MRVPILETAKQKYEIDLTAKSAQLVLAFADERRMLPVEEFVERHIEVLAQVFKVRAETVKELNAFEIVAVYLYCLEYIAREFKNISGGESPNVSKHNKRQRNKKGSRKFTA